MRELAEALSPLAEYAGELGVRLALEPLNRFETSLFNTAEQTLEVVEAVGSPALGLLLDTFHMNIEERSSPAAVRLAGSGSSTSTPAPTTAAPRAPTIWTGPASWEPWPTSATMAQS